MTIVCGPASPRAAHLANWRWNRRYFWFASGQPRRIAFRQFQFRLKRHAPRPSAWLFSERRGSTFPRQLPIPSFMAGRARSVN